MENLQEISEIQQFYAGQTVFITGATGFLGKIVLEKLLRSCPDIKKIYVLIREKKGKSIETRLQELFSAKLFDPLRNENANFHKKVHLICGDCEQPGLGLSSKDKKTLIDDVSSVFHVAAIVKFTEPIRIATNINVRSVSDLLDMAKEMPKLKAFVYVSTAFSNSNRDSIEERVYKTPINGEQLISLVDAVERDDILDLMTPKLLHNWKNTYCFTKAVAENVVHEKGKSLPVVIVRPAIVMPTIDDPVTGWSDSIFGIVGMVLAIALGIVRCIKMDENKRAELVPADHVTSCMIAAGWAVAANKGKNRDQNKTPVYNFVTSPKNPVTWGALSEYVDEFRVSCPSVKAIWYPYVIFTKSSLMLFLFQLFLHTIPGYLMDAGLFLVGKKPKLTKGYKKIHKFTDVISHFTMREWEFSNKNTQNLWMKLNNKDKRIFKFDMESLSWNESKKIIHGARVYLAQDPIETIPQGQRNMRYFKIANNVLIIIALFIFSDLFFRMLDVIFNYLFKN